MVSVTERIQQLKKERNAIILAHNYTLSEIQDLADFVGDSLGLSMEASKTSADVIVFCGVTFMGETAKILSPDKTVLLPEPDAHCAMAAMCTGKQIKDYKTAHPGCTVVGYVNSTAESKKEMDVCCTSSNVIKVIESLRGKDVLLVPDRNLGVYASSETGIPIKLWNGFCSVHHGITAAQVMDLMQKYPDALVMAHPECRTEVLELADHVGSTESMIRTARTSDKWEFIVLTEIGMRHRLKKENPGKTFHFLENAVCTTMKMISPESVLDSLENGTGEVTLGRDVLEGARAPVVRMMDLT
ncbi:MAG: quinolinate synthase NadA [Candidatus Methanoplasma sp.]|jgi:quinolinate synthase|nr:quinolinate synthase NadA [Candidatus Methanoplasma sp.]